jgi:hypothetical protein
MEDLMKHIRLAAVIGTAAITAAGLGAGAAITACRSTAKVPAAAATPAAAPVPGGSAYSYYLSMMRRRYAGSSGSMMGGGTSYSWFRAASAALTGLYQHRAAQLRKGP